VQAGEHIAIIGLDQVTAEVFVNLVTGATLPDRGEVRLFGRPTSAIADSADWLAVVDRFGIVSPRAVLLDSLTVVQNLAMPFTLDEPPAEDIRRRAVALAERGGWTPPARPPAAGLGRPAVSGSGATGPRPRGGHPRAPHGRDIAGSPSSNWPRSAE
jgi:ABC-type lipoprotein export system ATPase subunit